MIRDSTRAYCLAMFGQLARLPYRRNIKCRKRRTCLEQNDDIGYGKRSEQGIKIGLRT